MKLRKSELYHEAPKLAEELWGMGFRPKMAEDLDVGDLIAFYNTDVFGLSTVGGPQIGRVSDVRQDDTGVYVTHDGVVTDSDECTEVWAKRAK